MKLLKSSNRGLSYATARNERRLQASIEGAHVLFDIHLQCKIFVCKLLTSKHKLQLVVRARAIWLAFEKFTRADLSQIAFEIM